jgi:two-component system NtrC family sensor kinase
MNALYADDDPTVRALLAAILSRLGHSGISAVDGEEAWRTYQSTRPPLVVLDIEMPHRTGLDVCRLIREQEEPKRDAFILVLTSQDTDEVLRSVLDAGADDYMTKPATAENLFARLSIADRRIHKDAERREMERDLQRARWLAGIGETTITLQHEINNPLAALLGHAELLLMDAREKGQENEQVRVIVEQAKRISRVIRRLSELQNPKSIEYASGARMIDLSSKE